MLVKALGIGLVCLMNFAHFLHFIHNFLTFSTYIDKYWKITVHYSDHVCGTINWGPAHVCVCVCVSPKLWINHFSCFIVAWLWCRRRYFMYAYASIITIAKSSENQYQSNLLHVHFALIWNMAIYCSVRYLNRIKWNLIYHSWMLIWTVHAHQKRPPTALSYAR